MLVNMHGRIAGSVSGGCLEKKVIAESRAALMDGRARLLSFDTTDQDDLAFGTSLGCQGKIWIGLEVLPAGAPWTLDSIITDVRRQRQPVAVITSISGDADAPMFSTSAQGECSFEASDDVLEVLRTRKTRFVGDETIGSKLIEWLGPPLSLLLFGAGPDVTPMVRLARELAHEVIVVDRRAEFAIPENFPGARVILAKPHQFTAKVSFDDRTVAVLMNHHYDTDRDVLAALIPLGIPYIAMLGPKRRTVRILDELHAAGHDISMVEDTLHGPAGLDVGAETPEQIALAILAEIQATLSNRDGGKLRQRNAPIHADAFPMVRQVCSLPA
jgi:xanthine dehydrogenase accessory factor